VSLESVTAQTADFIYEAELSRSPSMVLREAEALYEGRDRLRRTYERISRRLAGLSIRHSLVGGLAVFLHGLRRFTEDIDVLVTPHDLARLRNNLVGSGYVTVPGGTQSIRDAETGVRIDFVLSGQFPGDGKPKPVAFPEPEQGTETRDGLVVIDLRTLIELKLASGMTAPGRLQDLADVQRLIQVHRLGLEYGEKLHPYVRAKFRELAHGSHTWG
jgi:hypothetical protein